MDIITERRVKEHCIYCDGESLTLFYKGKLLKVCLICGKDFEARREADRHLFNTEADKWHGI